MTVTRRGLCLCGSLHRVWSNGAALEAARQLARLDMPASPATPSPQRKPGASDFGGTEPEALDSCFRRNDERSGEDLPPSKIPRHPVTPAKAGVQ
jgi:hypothetical protein